MVLDANNIVPLLADIVHRRGGESYLGEQVTMREHMLQAATLASEASMSDEIVAASLLHDIGHYTSEFATNAIEHGIDNRHQIAAAAVLAPYFPSLVVDCVEAHVDAKRYLCAVDATYLRCLSDASIASLALQGGPMRGDELEQFSQRAELDAALTVRRYDDAAKVVGRITPEFDAFETLLERLVARHRTCSAIPQTSAHSADTQQRNRS